MNLNIVIIEDEKHSRELLKKLLEDFCEDITILGMASSVQEAISLLSNKKPDLVFLDIELQPGTGFDILDQLDSIDFEIVFTTAFEQYAIKAIKMSSLDYLLKPIDFIELQKAVKKAKQKKRNTNYNLQVSSLLENIRQDEKKKICLATSEGYEFIDIKKIIYCKADGAYTHFILDNNETLFVSKHLKEYENILESPSFLRVHNSYLINLRKVKKYVKGDGGYILMINDDHLTISSRKKEIFMNAMKLL